MTGSFQTALEVHGFRVQGSRFRADAYFASLAVDLALIYFTDSFLLLDVSDPCPFSLRRIKPDY